MPEVQWYYARDEKQFGPVSATELKQLADSGQIAPDDLLWREGMDAWTTAVNLRGLFIEEAPSSTPRNSVPSTAAEPTVGKRSDDEPPKRTVKPAAASRVSLRVVLRVTQIMLWVMCVLVVLVGIGLFTRAFLVAKVPA